MPQGLQCRDANGRLIMDTTTRTSRVLGHIDASTTTVITHPGFAEGTPFWVFNFLGEASGYNAGTYGGAPLDVPVITRLNATQIQVQLWGTQAFRITYGIY